MSIGDELESKLAALELEAELDRLGDLIERGRFGEAKALAYALHRKACWLSNSLGKEPTIPAGSPMLSNQTD